MPLRVVVLVLCVAALAAAEPQVAVGDNHTVYLDSSGTLWTSGSNSSGQRGWGTIGSDAGTAQAVTLSYPAIAVAAGSASTYVLDGYGYVWAWGENGDGQLGNNDPTLADQASPVQVKRNDGSALPRCIAIAAGYNYALALACNGTVWAWGDDGFGQLGDANGDSGTVTGAVQVSGLTDIIAISAGRIHALALRADGTVWGWGYNTAGQCGDGAAGGNRYLPVPVSGITTAMGVAAGYDHSLALLANGTVLAWGADGSGQLGDDASFGTDRLIPTPVSGLYGIKAISASVWISAALRYDGTLLLWGSDSDGRQGDDALIDDNAVPISASGLTTSVRSVALSYHHAAAITGAGKVYAWGLGDQGQLIDGSVEDHSSPTPGLAIAAWPLGGLVQVSCGGSHTLACAADGSAWAWGGNSSGQLGDGTTNPSGTPVRVANLSQVIAVAAGFDFSMALTVQGKVFCWGKNDFGQLGNNSTTPSPVPVQAYTWGTGIAAGNYHAVVLDYDGLVACWGYNINGQCGDGTTTQRQVYGFVKTGSSTTLTNVRAVSAGGYTSEAIRADGGRLLGWGSNGSGQFGTGGTGTTNAYVVTTTSSEVANLRSLAVGGFHAHVIQGDGEVWGMGAGGNGRLGDGTTTMRSSPVNITVDGSVGLCRAVDGGTYHTVFVCETGCTRATGFNDYGQIGNNTSGTDVLTPTPVLYAGGASVVWPACVSAGTYHNGVVLTDGRVWTWGQGVSGQLGDGLNLNTDNAVECSRTYEPPVSVAVGDGSAGEGGNDGTFTISRDAAWSTAGALPVTISCAGGLGVDYAASPSATLVTIPAQSSSVTVTFAPIDDDIDEDGETATLTVVDGAHYRLGTTTAAGLVIEDNDTAGLQLSVASGTTYESTPGAPTTFTVRLRSRPTADVTLTLASSKTTEGRVDGDPAVGNQNLTSITFTPLDDDWKTARTIQVFGINDDYDDGPGAYTVSLDAASTGDVKYNNPAIVPVATVAMTNVNDDSAGFNIPASFTAITEGGSAGSFQISLRSRPYFPVTVTLASGDLTEASLPVGSQSVTFPADATWANPRTITVNPVDDFVDEVPNAVPFVINVTGTSSDDSKYHGKGPWAVSSACNDNDVKGIVVTAVDPPGDGTYLGDVSEAGTADSWTVRLQSQPTGPVTVSITGMDGQVLVDTDPGTAGDQTTLAFNDTNWNLARTVSVRAVNDSLIEAASHSVSIVHSAAGADYGGVTLIGRTVAITDDDGVGFTVVPTTATDSRLVVTEESATDVIFTVRLTSRPSDATFSVGVTVASLDTNRIQVFSGSSLTFTQDTWSTPQPVVLRGNLDDGNNGDEPISISLTGSQAGGSEVYQGATGTVYCLSDDDDVAGVQVATGDGVYVDEDGSPVSDTFTVRLSNVSPDIGEVVVVQVASSGRLTAGPAALVFTSTDYFTPQVVTVTVNNDLVDQPVASENGSVTLSVISSGGSAPKYTTGMGVPTVPVTIRDDDVAGVSVSPTFGLITTEGGFPDTLTIALTSQPTGNVEIDVTETSAEGYVTPNTLTFTPANWQIGQAVSVIGSPDAVVDGDQSMDISVQMDVANTDDVTYDAIDPPDSQAYVMDDDVAGLVVADGGGVVLTEGGGTDLYTVSLTSQPLSTVDVLVSADNQCLLRRAGTSDPFTASLVLTFTSATWSSGIDVEVQAVDDSVVEGNHEGVITHAVTAGAEYLGVPAATLTADLVDGGGETPDILLTSAGGLATTEQGGSDTVHIALGSQPLLPVTLILETNEPDEVVISPRTVTIFPDPTSWQTGLDVTVWGLDDRRDDGAASYRIMATAFSGDAAYNGLAEELTGSNADDDVPGLVIHGDLPLTVDERGQIAGFAVALTCEPDQPVTLTVTSSAPDEAVPDPATTTLVFDNGNWWYPRTVWMLPVDDAQADGPQPFTVTCTTASSQASFQGLTDSSVGGTCEDDDKAGISLSQRSIRLGEDDAPVQVLVRLLSQPAPATTVRIVLTNGAPAQMLIDQTALTFTDSDWDQAQSLTLTPINDVLVDGEASFTLTAAIDTVTTTDAGYDALAAITADVVVADDDVARLDVSASATTIAEAGGTVTVSVVLTSRPTADVTVAITGLDDEADAVPASRTFIPSEWNLPQTFTVTGRDDAIVDGNHVLTVVFDLTTADADYAAIPVDRRSGALTVTDDDVVGVLVTQSDGSTAVDEYGATDTISVVLRSQPAGDVTVGVFPDSQLTVQGAGVSTALLFTPSTWNVPQTVTVGAAGDDVDEVDVHSGNLTFLVQGATGYAGLVLPSVAVTITDDNLPTLSGALAFSVGRGGFFAVDQATLDAADDHAVAATLTLLVLLPPGQGDLTLDGTALVINDTLTLADLIAGRLAYRHNGSASVRDGFAIQVVDDRGHPGDVAVVAITVTGYIAPAVTVSGGGTYTEDGAALVLVTAAGIDDDDSPWMSGGSLTVSVAGGEPADLVTVRDQGTATGQIGVSGSTITYGGSAIGSAAGGSGAPLVISLSGGAACTRAAVDALIENLLFSTPSQNPSAAARTVSITLVDDTNTAGVPATVAVTVVPVNDAPTLTIAGPLVTPAGVAVDGVVTASDPDDATLALSVTAIPGKGFLDPPAGTVTLAAGSAAVALHYTTADDQVGADSFTLRVADAAGLAATLDVPVALVSSGAAKPWVVSDPPRAIELGGFASYPLRLDAAALAQAPGMTWSLLGTLPAGITASFNNDALTEPTLVITVADGVTAGFLRLDLLGVDEVNQTAVLHPVTVVLVAGGGGAG